MLGATVVGVVVVGGVVVVEEVVEGVVVVGTVVGSVGGNGVEVVSGISVDVDVGNCVVFMSN